MSLRPVRYLPVLCYLTFLLLLSPAAHAETWALLIGVDSYDSSEITPLHGAVNDALALKQTLIDTGLCKPDNIILLATRTGLKRPDRDNILEETDNLQARVKKGDTVFAFFSGHGCQDSGKTYLLSCNVRTSSIPTVKRTAVDVEDFEDALHRLPDARVIIAYDMCRVEIGKDGSTTTTPLMQGKGQDFSISQAKIDDKPVSDKVGPLLVRWWSCSPGERSYEVKTTANGHEAWRGYFSSVLERGLKGAAATSGTVTLASLARYVHDTVADEVKRQQSREQQPRLLLDIGNPDDVFNFVLGAGQPVIVAPVVIKKDLHARLRVSVNAPGAAVTVEGQLLANGEDYIESLAETEKKTVTVKVKAPGYDPDEETVEIIRGKLVSLPVTLDKHAMPEPAKIEPAPPPVTDVLRLPAPRTLAEYKAQMVIIPGGTFTMGDGNFEQPAHQVTLSSFRMGRTPVTVAMWKEYCQKTGKAMPPVPDWGWIDNHPMVAMTWDEAKAYCDWAGMLLPTEAQWEFAAKGGQQTKYPWGNTWDTNKLICCRNSHFHTAPVYRRDSVYVNRFGLVDMSGNIFQWCADRFGPYSDEAVTDPTGPSIGGRRVLRGGSWFNDPAALGPSVIGSFFWTSNRESRESSERGYSYGLRPCLPAGN